MKRFLSLFLALIVAVGICLSAPMTIEAEAAQAHTLNVDLNLIKKCGRQAIGTQICGCMSAAYCRAILDKKVHYWYEYDASGTGDPYRGWAHWSAANYINTGLSSKQAVFKAAYDQINAGRPCVFHVVGRAGSEHYIVCVGYVNVTDVNNLSAKNFLILDTMECWPLQIDNMASVGYDLLDCQFVYTNSGNAGALNVQTHTIAYNANGGSGSMASYQLQTDQYLNFNGSSFTRAGYKQIGWNVLRSSDNKWYVRGTGWRTQAEIDAGGLRDKLYLYPMQSNTMQFGYSDWCNPSVTKDTFTFYAVWERLPYYATVNYNANGGKGSMSSYQLDIGEFLKFNGSSFARSGYEQTGWNVLRASDNKWFVPDKGWLTESEIMSFGYTKYLYPLYTNSYQLTKTDWCNPNATEDTFTFYAVWKCKHSIGTVTDGICDPTYTEVGYTGDTKCAACGEILSKGTTIPKLTLSVPTVKIVNATNGINVTWNSVDGAEKYIVYRKTYNDSTKVWGGWETLITDCTATSYVDTKALLGVYYKYTAVAVAGDNKSSFVATSALLRDVAPTVKVANANAGINVTWNSVYGAQKYTVYRKTYNDTTKAWSSWETLTSNCTTTSYTDAKALFGVKYMYTVVAVRNGVNSSFVASGTLQRDVAPVVKVANANAGINVTWNSVYGAQKYTVYRKVYNATTKTWSSWETVVSNCTTTSYTDTKSLIGEKYKYTVVAVRGDFKSTFVETTLIQRDIAPTVKVANSTSGVTVTWNSLYGAQKYIVYRKTYNDSTKAWSSWEVLTSNCTATSYTDAKALLGVKYMYTVRATRNGVSGSFVASKELQRNTSPVVAAKNITTGIKITWNSVYGAQKYIVYRKTYNATKKTWGSWEIISNNCTSTSYVDKKALYNAKCMYTVVAERNNVRSTFVASDAVKCDIVPEVKAVNNSDCIKVTWNSINGATSYRVYRKTYDEATKTWGEWDRLENGYKSTSYADKKAMLSVSYKYTVRAVISEDVRSSYVATPVIKRNVTPVVKATNTNAGVNVTWNSVYGAQKYIVYRKTYNDTTKAWGSWETLINNCIATSYVDKTALLGERYKYTVVAVRNNFKSTFAETPLLQRDVAPAVTIAKQSNGIKVNWSSVYGAQKYTVYRKTYNATTKTWSSWEVVKSGCTTTSYTDTSAKNGTYYRYTVCGVRNNFQGSFVQSSVLQYVK